MIHTKRSILRPIHRDDSDAFFAYRSDAVTNRYQGWVPSTQQETDDFIARNPAFFNVTGTWFQLAVEDASSHRVIGDIGVHFVDADQCELGCTFSKEHHGKGWATETMSAVIHYLFHDLKKHRITASVDVENHASIRLLERLGFRKEAHFKKSLLINGQWVDDVVYAVLAEEWEQGAS